MEILKITQVTLESIAKIVSKHIKEGKLVIIPVDTAYAISTTALDEKAIKKVFEVKKRGLNNPIHICVNGIESAKKYSEISPPQEKILSHFLPGAYTFILKKKDIVPSILTGGLDTVGLRIPDSTFITMLSNYLEVPFTITSANYSEMQTAYTMDEIKKQFTPEDLHKHFASVVESDVKLLGTISTIIDLTNEKKPKVLREGAVDSKKFFSDFERIIK
jgi:L-threonylcarbamoyladenylate synthase